MDSSKKNDDLGKNEQNSTSDFVRLITANQSQIYAYVMSLVGNSADADDIMQETTAMMWQKFEDFKAGTDFVSWGMAIAYYKVKEFRRSRSHEKCQFDDETLDILSQKARQNLLNSSVYLDKLQDCMKKLNPRDLQLIKLRYISGVSMNELSHRFDKTVRNIYYQIAKIQGFLMRCIERAISSEGQIWHRNNL